MFSYEKISLVGNLAEKFGAKWIFGGGILISGLLSLIAPTAAHIDYRLFFIIRFVTGIVSSPGFPSAAALWGKWVLAIISIFFYS